MGVDIDDLAKWVNSLSPKSIHDFKPLIVLLQSILKVMIQKELDFFSGTIKRFEQQLAEAMQLIQEQEFRIEDLLRQLQEMSKELEKNQYRKTAGLWMRQAGNALAAKDSQARTPALLASPRCPVPGRCILNEERKTFKDMEDDKQKLRALLEEKDTLLAHMHTQLRDKDKEIDDLRKALAAAEAQAEKDANERDHAKLELDALTKGLDAATNESKAKSRTIKKRDEKVKELEAQLMSLTDANNIGGTTIHVPENDTQTLTVEANSIVNFSSGTATGDVMVPGSTTIILPTNLGEENITLAVPPGTRVVPPLGNRDEESQGAGSLLFFAPPASILYPAACRIFLAASIPHPAACRIFAAASILYPAACSIFSAASILYPAACSIFVAASILYPAACRIFVVLTMMSCTGVRYCHLFATNH
eukprot:gene4053-5026_t